MVSHVYFTYTDRPYWWTRFLKKGFSHVFVLIPQHEGYLFIESTLSSIDVKYLTEHSKLPKSLDKSSVVVKYCTEIDYNLTSSWLRPCTCVEVVKRIIGLDKWWIFTPYQLYRYILWEAHRRHPKPVQHKQHSI
jgi:hypothetical protein